MVENINVTVKNDERFIIKNGGFFTNTTLGTKTVDESNIGNGKILYYDSTTDKLYYDFPPEGGGGGGSSTLDGLYDVTITNVTDNQSLVYDSASGVWVNKTLNTDMVVEGNNNKYYSDLLVKSFLDNNFNSTSSISVENNASGYSWSVKVDNNTIVVDSTNNYIKVKDNVFANINHSHVLSDVTDLNSTDDLPEGNTNKYDKTVVFTGGTNVTITGTYPNFTINDNTVSTTDFNSHVNDSSIHFTQSSISITSSQVSDFNTAVSNNVDVSTNTSERNKTLVSSTDTTSGYLSDKFVAGTNVTISTLNSGSNEQLEVSVPNVGEANTISSVGSGTSLVSGKVGVDLQLKSLVAGTNITLTDNGDSVTISSTASSGGSSSWIVDRYLDGEVYVTNLPYVRIPTGVSNIDDVAVTLLSLPTGSDFKIDVRKNGLATTDSILSGEIIITTTQTPTSNGVYTTKGIISNSSVIEGDVLYFVITQVGSTFGGSDLSLTVKLS